MRYEFVSEGNYTFTIVTAFVRWFSDLWLEEVGYNSSFRYFDKPPPLRLGQLGRHIETVIVIGEDETRPVGYGHLDFDQKDFRVWLGVAVFPQYWRNGIADAICRHLVTSAIEEDVHEVWLSVDKDNPNAQGLYDKFGFIAAIRNPNNIFMKKVFDTK